MKAKTHFIQDAVAHAHGQFKAKAKAAGMSTAAFARLHEHDTDLTGEQARLALTLMGLPHHPKKSA